MSSVLKMFIELQPECFAILPLFLLPFHAFSVFIPVHNLVVKITNRYNLAYRSVQSKMKTDFQDGFDASP